MIPARKSEMKSWKRSDLVGKWMAKKVHRGGDCAFQRRWDPAHDKLRVAITHWDCIDMFALKKSGFKSEIGTSPWSKITNRVWVVKEGKVGKPVSAHVSQNWLHEPFDWIRSWWLIIPASVMNMFTNAQNLNWKDEIQISRVGWSDQKDQTGTEIRSGEVFRDHLFSAPPHISLEIFFPFHESDASKIHSVSRENLKVWTEILQITWSKFLDKESSLTLSRSTCSF